MTDEDFAKLMDIDDDAEEKFLHKMYKKSEYRYSLSFEDYKFNNLISDDMLE